MKNLSENWQKFLCEDLKSDYMKSLNSFVKEERAKFNVFPKSENVFNALNLVSPEKVKVVIIGQDPYHEIGQAHGLCFSVPNGTKLPPSLVNIFKEIEADVGIKNTNGDLTNWAKQGVLLLNSVLTVRQGVAGSHAKRGWETFTKSIIKKLSETQEKIIFVLWGNYAKSLSEVIDQKKHFILSCAHPSPLSAFNGFFGCKHFSKINKILQENGKQEIDWRT